MNETNQDIDPIETQEWCDALQAVVDHDGAERASYLMQTLLHQINLKDVSCALTSAYRNTLSAEEPSGMPDEAQMLSRVSALIRWNAVAMVLRAGKYAPELGGHIASYASAAMLYEIGFNYFFLN